MFDIMRGTELLKVFTHFKVTIVLPIHNAAAWLPETLQSIVSQSYRGPLEISACDDHSTVSQRRIFCETKDGKEDFV